jgi:hypothetical protein
MGGWVCERGGVVAKTVPKVKLRRSGATVDNVDGSVFCRKGNSSCSCDLSNEVAAFHQTKTIKSGLFCFCVDKPKNSSQIIKCDCTERLTETDREKSPKNQTDVALIPFTRS